METITLNDISNFVEKAEGKLGLDLSTGVAMEPIHHAKTEGSYWLALEPQAQFYPIALGAVKSSGAEDKIMVVPITYQSYMGHTSCFSHPDSIDFMELSDESFIKEKFSLILASFPWYDLYQCIGSQYYGEKFFPDISKIMAPNGKLVISTELEFEFVLGINVLENSRTFNTQRKYVNGNQIQSKYGQRWKNRKISQIIATKKI